MKLLVLTVVLAVMQAAPPVPQPQTTDKPAGSDNNVQSKPKQNPSPSLTPVEPLIHIEPKQNATYQPNKANTPELIPVCGVSPVSVDSFWWNRSYVIFTGLLVGVGIAGAYLAKRTLRRIEEAGKQTDRMLALAEKQAESAKVAAEAARDNVAIDRESLQTVQRAYVTFPMFDLQMVKVDNKWYFRLAIENTGNTPAHIGEICVNYQWYPGASGLPEDYPFSDQRTDKRLFFTSLAAKGKTYSSKLEIEHAVIQQVYAGQARLFFYGWVTYKDVFEGTNPHRTDFCNEIRILEIAEPRLVFEISAYHKHNNQT
jgi:hypothetical protein